MEIWIAALRMNMGSVWMYLICIHIIHFCWTRGIIDSLWQAIRLETATDDTHFRDTNEDGEQVRGLRMQQRRQGLFPDRIDMTNFLRLINVWWTCTNSCSRYTSNLLANVIIPEDDKLANIQCTNLASSFTLDADSRTFCWWIWLRPVLHVKEWPCLAEVLTIPCNECWNVFGKPARIREFRENLEMSFFVERRAQLLAW